MENINWMDVTAGGLAIAVFVGGLTMMFTNLWTTKTKK